MSTASLDCLAIIAYKQPIGRFEVEVNRGVDLSGGIKTLNFSYHKKTRLKTWKSRVISNYRYLFGKFWFDKKSDLPTLKEITELIELDSRLGEQIAVFEKQHLDKSYDEKKNKD